MLTSSRLWRAIGTCAFDQGVIHGISKSPRLSGLESIESCTPHAIKRYQKLHFNGFVLRRLCFTVYFVYFVYLVRAFVWPLGLVLICLCIAKLDDLEVLQNGFGLSSLRHNSSLFRHWGLWAPNEPQSMEGFTTRIRSCVYCDGLWMVFFSRDMSEHIVPARQVQANELDLCPTTRHIVQVNEYIT